jgi:hypothetical protein
MPVLSFLAVWLFLVLLDRLPERSRSRERDRDSQDASAANALVLGMIIGRAVERHDKH